MVRSANSQPTPPQSSAISKRRRSRHPSSHSPPQSIPSLFPPRTSGSDSGSPSTRAENYMDDEIEVVANGSTSTLVRIGVPERPMNPFPGFVPGNLLKVRMCNFLTYTDTAIFPGPRMNVVLGPNGTGKSSIVNAVCLVFAGSLRLLGRSTDLGAFVKHGEQNAMIEAHIYDPKAKDGRRVVKRKFDTDGKGSFEVDERKITRTELQKEVNQRYDIQLDNLSQFMAQEKIADFVNLRSGELLVTTVRSLGGAEKETTYNELQELDKVVVDGGQELENKIVILKALEEQHQAEKADIEAYRKEQEYKKKLSLLKKYRHVLEAKECRERYISALQERKDYEDDLGCLKAEMQTKERGEYNRCLQELDAVTGEYRASKEACRTCETDVLHAIQESDDMALKLSNKTRDLQEIESNAERRKKDIEKAEHHLASLEQALEQSTLDVKEQAEQQRQDELQTKRAKIVTELNLENNHRVPLESKRSDAARQIKHHNYRLATQSNVREERIQQISQQTRKPNLLETDRLVKELQRQGKFQRNVCGPVGAEIEVNNKYHARIMESCCQGFYMAAFVTESARDSRLLIAECKRRFNGWAPDMISAPTTRDDELDIYAIQSQVPQRPVDDRLRNLGIVAVVNDLYRAPDAVRAAMNAQASLYQIHVGSERASACTDQLRHEKGVQSWYTPTTRCKVLTSRYDRNARTLTQDTNFANVKGHLFSSKMEEAEREQERLKMMIRDAEEEMKHAGQQLKNIDERVYGLNENLKETDQEMRDLISRRRERRQGRARVEAARRRVEERREKAAAELRRNNKQVLMQEVKEMQEQAARKIPVASKEVSSLLLNMRRMDDMLMKRIVAERALVAEESKQSQAQELIKERESLLDAAKIVAREAKKTWKDKDKLASQQLSQEQMDANRELFEAPEASDSKTLTDEIARLGGEIDGLTTGHEVIERYIQRQKKIEELSGEVQSQSANRETQLTKLRTRKKEFLEWLESGVNKMRRKFSSLYQRLGCSGDLELINVDSESIGDLELQVLVSYREGAELRPISAMSNSGGEKMCCTMLFCFSLLLEEERMPPFVFVDELNQGLDYLNEEKIMTMMFEDAAKDRAPQSFVITPKLLPDLPFHAQTMSHVIFNGLVTGNEIYN